MEQVKINISRIIEEDTLKNTLSFGFLGSRRRYKLTCSFIMETANGCCSSPLRVGQSIRLKPDCSPILIDQYSSIIYDVTTNAWNVSLPTQYFQDFDIIAQKIMKNYGFDKMEWLKDGIFIGVK